MTRGSNHIRRLTGHKRRWSVLLCAMVLATLAGAQQIGKNNTSQEAATFKVNTQLVVETVVVKDKSGNSIDGLTAKDFTITENGVPQTIKFFEFQKLEEAAD